MRTFIINRMYAGSYISDKMGGEFLNLLHDDHENNYIFINPYGFIDYKYNNTVEGIILTRLVKAGVFEVLGIALIDKDGQITYQKGSTLKERFENGKEHIEKYAKEHNIRYSGFSLKDINLGSFYGADITFKSRELLLNKKDLFITDSEQKEFEVEGSTTINLEDKRFPKQSLHSYITDKDNPKAFESILKMINDDSLWDKGRINKVEEGRIIDRHFNLLEVIRKDYDELAYSNFFAYIFKNYPVIFRRFAKQKLGVDIKEPYFIYREKANIDLWIEDDNNIVVIENKIKSGINGISARHDFSEGGLVQSQLLKYYEYTEKEKCEKNTHYFIFVPDYNKINLSLYSGSGHYQEIKYSEIYNFFNKVEIDDLYFEEFVNALYKHTKDREIDYAEDMNIRFLDRLRKIKK